MTISLRFPALCLVCVSLALALYSCAAIAEETRQSATGDDPSDLRVMTFNIRYNNPKDGADAWPHRIDMVADRIRQSADVVGLQEARQEQIQDLAGRLDEYQWFGVGRDDGQQGGEFCPIFYRADRLKLLETKVAWLSETPDVPGSKSWDAAITRLMTMVKFRDQKSGGVFWMINTHFDHRGPQSRIESAKIIRTTAQQFAADYPVVVTGDFNCLPDSRPYQIITDDDDESLLADARTITQTPHRGPDSTWSGFREVEDGRRIDFIFVTSDVQVRRHVTFGDQVGGRFPSDHLPVVAAIRFVPR
ncbi:endonuclease/exonuclease/phosphatase family protein [Crateriforma conspicua]|uniref:endonuclease/exonuclease/phosphatase family protein n=1 Tax=Crateriforma conspicua TaxID=2527996 RepID=UPI00118B7890|nr:endonuclease/exonuclease/phosphatase family protein [Crateriforma conspicua]QDV64014.1 Endonuclease/Exonuclease/phosphatase family protein [Crateriforma conspicua]